MLATLYERGLSFEDAARKKEFMYIAFWDKRNDAVNNLDELLKYKRDTC